MNDDRNPPREKFPVGSQWRTKGNWLAVVLKHCDSMNIKVWHDSREGSFVERPILMHDPGEGWAAGDSTGLYQLVELWSEPRDPFEVLRDDFETRKMQTTIYQDICRVLDVLIRERKRK